MNRSLTATFLALTLAFAAFVIAAPAVLAQSGMRTLVGVVLDKSDRPVPDAIVYLKNTKTLTVKTYIAGSDGSYRFHALSPNVDYEVWAEHQGAKSDTKTLSSFDTRANARINLRVNPK